MTSPALLDLGLDTPSISGAFTAPAAAEAVIMAVLGITSRFIHADQGEPTRRKRGYATTAWRMSSCTGPWRPRAERERARRDAARLQPGVVSSEWPPWRSPCCRWSA